MRRSRLASLDSAQKLSGAKPQAVREVPVATRSAFWSGNHGGRCTENVRQRYREPPNRDTGEGVSALEGRSGAPRPRKKGRPTDPETRRAAPKGGSDGSGQADAHPQRGGSPRVAVIWAARSMARPRRPRQRYRQMHANPRPVGTTRARSERVSPVSWCMGGWLLDAWNAVGHRGLLRVRVSLEPPGASSCRGGQPCRAIVTNRIMFSM